MAHQILASINDINGELPDLVKITDADDMQYQIDAKRLINSQLAGIFSPATLQSWITPDVTPGLIRLIAGKLIASQHYAIQFSQENTDRSSYAADLYAAALQMIAGIRSGMLIVVDDSGVPIDAGGTLDLNSATDVLVTTPVFTMDREFA
jgi:hypothetical protein